MGERTINKDQDYFLIFVLLSLSWLCDYYVAIWQTDGIYLMRLGVQGHHSGTNIFDFPKLRLDVLHGADLGTSNESEQHYTQSYDTHTTSYE